MEGGGQGRGMEIPAGSTVKRVSGDVAVTFSSVGWGHEAWTLSRSLQDWGGKYGSEGTTLK